MRKFRNCCKIADEVGLNTLSKFYKKWFCWPAFAIEKNVIDVTQLELIDITNPYIQYVLNHLNNTSSDLIDKSLTMDPASNYLTSQIINTMQTLRKDAF